MFIWTAVAHVATPLATIGFSQIPNEAQVRGDVQSNVTKPGLYIFPWVDPKDPKAMQKMYALEEGSPRPRLSSSTLRLAQAMRTAWGRC